MKNSVIEFDAKKTFRLNGVMSNYITQKLNISRVTLNDNQKQFNETKKCVNKKCMLLFATLNKRDKCNKQYIESTVTTIGSIYKYIDMIKYLNDIDDLEHYKKVISMVYLLFTKESNEEIDHKKFYIEFILKDIAVKANMYYNGQKENLDKTIGLNIMTNRDFINQKINKINKLQEENDKLKKQIAVMRRNN